MEEIKIEIAGRSINIATDFDFKTEKNVIDQSLSIVDGELKLRLFKSLVPMLSSKGYWYALGRVYTTCNCVDSISITEKRRLFYDYRPHREYLMTSDERRFLDARAKKVTLYRAMSINERESGEFGISWTLNKAVAEFYAYKYQGYELHRQEEERVVHSVTAEKENLIAYFKGRKEKEVIYVHFSDGKLDEIF
ncbi:MAG: hypothetical protein JNL40_07425 [Cyclobacteriaceae bacterium]|nr:hypothetical protein [Cyclobacteriaceae bacterium]